MYQIYTYGRQHHRPNAFYGSKYCCKHCCTRRRLPCVDVLVLLLPLGVRPVWIYLDLNERYLAIENCARCDQVQHKRQKPCGDELDHTACHLLDLSCAPSTERKDGKRVDVASGSKAAIGDNAVTTRCSINQSSLFLIFFLSLSITATPTSYTLFPAIKSADVVPAPA